MSKQIGGAKGGGQGSAEPRTPIIQADSVRSKAMIEVVEAWGWGQIGGFATADPLMSIKLDGTPIKSLDGTLNFQGISIDYRLGTQDQAYIPGTLEDAIGSPVSVNTPVVFATPITKTINDVTTDAVRIIVTYAALISQNSTNGDRSSVTVELKIEVRPLGATGWITADLQGRGRIHDKIESPYQRAFTINLKAIDSLATSYDIRVSRVSADPISNGTISEQSAFQWDSYVKLTYAKLRRPNIPHIRILFDARYFKSVPVRSYDLKGALIKVPPASVYNPVTREYTNVDWDGQSMVMAYCNCPAWILYHILTTGGIGLGAEINQAYQDKWSIFTIAKRCDEKVPDGAGGQECRYSLDAQFMTQVSAHELVNQIAGTFDAMPLWDGKSVYLTQDAPKPVSSLYCPANVLDGRFVYQGSARQTRYTAALIQYNDLTDQSRLATEYVEDFSAIDRYGYRPITETAIGCTSRSQAHRRGKRLLITGRDETDAVAFSVGLSGINNKPGDIIRIADPLKAKGARLGGRLSTGSTITVIKLDSAVILESNKSYKLAIIGNDGVVVESPIITAAGTVSTVTVGNAFPAAPEVELEFIVYVQSDVSRLFRILGIAENEDGQQGFYTISATQYSSTKFADIDSIADLTPLAVNPYQITSVAPPSGILVNEGVYTGIEGLIRYLDISWSASNDMLLRGYHLIYRHNGITLFDSEITGQTYRIVNPLAGSYEITVSSVAVTGRYSTSVTVTHELGELYPIESVHVTNLVLKGNTGATFSGKEPEFTWDTDALAVLGFSTTFAAGAGGQSPWFRDFQIDIYDPDDATIPAPIVRTEFVTESAYVYTYEKNLLDDGPHRRVKAVVRARDNYGRYSAGMTIIVANPAPTAINPLSVSIFAGYKSLIIKYTKPSDNDWLGVVVFVSTVSGFTPATTNKVFSGTDLSVVIPNLTEGSYFIRLAAYDAFGSENDYVLTTDEFTKAVGNLDAASLFTWIRYADTPTTGMANVSTNKSYIDIAYNKASMTESESYADYEWSKSTGPQGEQGDQGAAVRLVTSRTADFASIDNALVTPAQASITFTPLMSGIVPTSYAWTFIKQDGSALTLNAPFDATTSTITISSANFTQGDSARKSLKVICKINGNANYVDETTISRLDNSTAGAGANKTYVDDNGNIQGVSSGAGIPVSNAVVESAIGKNKWLVRRYDTTISINTSYTVPTYEVINKATLGSSTYYDSTATNFSFGADDYIGIASCSIYSATAWTWDLTVNHDDNGTIYINGAQVYSHTIGTQSVSLSIPAGWCTIELLWAEQTGGDNFYISQAISARAEISQMYAAINSNSGQIGSAANTAAWLKIANRPTALVDVNDSTIIDNSLVRVGGTNLLQNSGQFANLDYWNSNGSIVSLDTTVLYAGYPTMKIVNSGGVNHIPTFMLKANTEYTISALVKGSSALAGGDDTTLHIQNWKINGEKDAQGNALIHWETTLNYDTNVTSV